MNDLGFLGDDPEARRARRMTKLAVWAFAIVELAVMVAAFVLKSR